MSIATPSFIDPAVGEVLREVGKFIRPAKERTLFSLGGRSYYENPASDVLAFFLTPGAEHGFHSLFLQVFLDCIEEDSTQLSYDGVTVSRESQTIEGKRIDLVVEGRDWVFLIENKICHGQVNPFASYEAYGRSLARGKKLLMAILSPGGTSIDPAWKALSYQKYCTFLRQRLSEALFDRAYSKWVVFAREFVLHLENELHQPTNIMTENEADFVEQYSDAIAQVKKLSSDYRKFLLDTLQERLTASGSGEDFTTKDDGWAVRCYSEGWGRSNLAFWSTSSGAAAKKFQVTVYLSDLTEERQVEAHKAFSGMKHWTERGWWAWQTQPGFDKREDAITEMCRLADVVSRLFPLLPAPAQPSSSSPVPA
jgi:PD-(D/E)XK nuclease superfamily